MNQIKIVIILIVTIFVLLVVSGVTPTLAGSPSSAPPTVVLPTPVATNPKPAATTVPAGKAPTRAAPVTAPTRVAPVAVKAPRGPAGSWITDFTLFNLSAASQANVTLMRYTQCVGACSTDSGTVVTPPSSWSNPACNGCIPAGGSAYYNPASDSGFPSFGGSITVSSDQQLAGTVTAANTSTGASYASDAYSAVSSPGTSVFLPIVMSGVGVWNTQMAIQNAGTANTNVTVHYVGTNAPGDTIITNLPPNMTAIVDQSGMASNFNGSATVTSTSQNVAVIVEEYKTTGGVLIAYNGVPSADANSTVYLPGFLIQGVWATDFTIVNTESAAANVTVTFTGKANTLTGTIPANGSVYINPFANVYGGFTGTAPSPFYGGATVTSTNGKKLVVVYNIANSAAPGAGNSQMGYVGFPPTKGATKVVVPLIENMASTGWVTTFSILSIDGTAANLSMVYSGNMTPTCNPCTYNMTAGDAGAKTFNQVTDGHVPTGFLGGVTITSTNGKQIVVIADQNNTTAANYKGGDAQAGFTGFVAP